MAGFFSELDNLEEDLLGPDYPYYKQIKTPTELGITPTGGWGELAGDIAGLIDYIELLVAGPSAASKTGQPLGNKFFLKTPATCYDKSSEDKKSKKKKKKKKKKKDSDSDTGSDSGSDSESSKPHRYIYVNNVPQGNIPFLSEGIDADVTEFRGIIPGLMSNLNVLNPMNIFKSFTLGPNPPCRPLTMQVIDASDNITFQTRHVLDEDIKEMDPCLFINESFQRTSNPITGEVCREAFQNLSPSKYPNKFSHDISKMPNDALVQIYYICLAILALYLLLKLCKKIQK